jgi:NTE family protein
MQYFPLIICLLLLQSISSIAQTDFSINKQPKVAVVLSGGGAKGFAHIGVLKVLEQEGIPIDIIVGTSMGSLIGGFYSLGYTAEEIEYIVKSQNWEKVLSDNVPRNDLSKNFRFQNHYSSPGDNKRPEYFKYLLRLSRECPS